MYMSTLCDDLCCKQKHCVHNIAVFLSPNVPKEYLAIQGAVLLLSVFDYDRFGEDDFAGKNFCF